MCRRILCRNSTSFPYGESIMEFKHLQDRALDIRQQFEMFEKSKYGRSWTKEEVALGFIGDIGDLAKLLLAEAKVRSIPDHREKLEHELADCLWSVIVLAKLYDIDLEKSFLKTMNDLQTYLSKD